MSSIDDAEVRFYVDPAAPGFGRVGAEARTRDGLGEARRQVSDVTDWAEFDSTGLTEVSEPDLEQYLIARKWPGGTDHATAIRQIVCARAYEDAAPKRWSHR